MLQNSGLYEDIVAEKNKKQRLGYTIYLKETNQEEKFPAFEV